MTKDPKKIRVLELVPSEGQATKPSELIQIRGHELLSLEARRAITALWHTAHRQGIEKGKTYQIHLSELVPSKHKGYERLGEVIETLMKTLIVVPLPGGRTRRTQVLGGNDMDDARRATGMLSYRFDEALVEILQDSEIWGRISMPELMALSSKYSVSLFEHVSQWIGLRGKSSQIMSIEELRAMLGVEQEKYKKLGVLNQQVLKRAVEEINALAPFSIDLQFRKTRNKFTHAQISWWEKTIDEKKQAYAELQRPKVGRRARITGQVETLVEPDKE